MKFKYKKINSEVIRPIIPVGIISNGNCVRYEVLVDSGADICIFDAQIADILGIDIVKGTKSQVIGITGFPENYYVHTVTIGVGGWKFKIDAGFKNMGGMSYGIVGQKGFFDLFKVKFDYLKGDIELTPFGRCLP